MIALDPFRIYFNLTAPLPRHDNTFGMACEGRGMKGSKKLSKPIFLACIADTALLIFTALAGDTSCGYVAHEWGTFTWVQSVIGKLLE